MLLVGCGRASRDVEIVLPETRFEIATNAPAVIERELPAGTYSVVLAEDEIDTRASVMLADRTIVLEDPVERHGRQIAYFVLPATAPIRIEVQSTDHRTKTGGSRIEIARWTRAANAEPTDAEQGDSAYTDAIAAYAKDKEQSFKDADAALEAAAYRYRKANDSRAEVTALHARGRLAYLVAGDWQAAERSARAARDIAADLDDSIAVARADMLIASARIERAGELAGDAQREERTELLSTADKLLKSSAATFSRLALPIDLAAALTFQGVGQWATRAAGPARATFEKAVQVAHDSNDAFSEARALGNLAWLDYERADIHAAAAEYERLLQLVERDRQPDLYASHVANFAFCLVALGDFDRAIGLHNSALELFTELNDESERAKQLLAIGSLYLRSGNPARAIETLKVSIALLEDQKDQLGLDSALRLAGNAAAALGQSDLALEYHTNLSARTLDERTLSLARILMAGDLRALRRLEEAKRVLADTLESDIPTVRGRALIERGMLFEAQQRFAEAAKDYSSADKMYADLRLDYPRIEANTGKSRSLLASGDARGAIEAADEAIEIVSSIRMRAANPELRARFVSSEYSPYEAKIDALLTAERGTISEGADIQALQTAESVRALELSELRSRTSVISDKQAEYDQLRDSLTAQQLRLESRLQRTDTDDTKSLELRRAIEETRAQIDALSSSGSPSIHAVQIDRAGKRSASELLGSIPTDTAVLYFFVGDNSTVAWLLTREGISHRILPSRSALEQFVDGWVSQVRGESLRLRSTNKSQDTRTIRELMERLVVGVTQRRLVIAPDGPLNAMPFASLRLPAGSQQRYWLDQFEISFVPSIRSLTTNSSPSQPTANLVAVISDPVYAMDDLRLSGVHRGIKQASGATRNSDSNFQFVRLPFSSVEAQAIGATFPEDDIVKLSGFDATVSRVAELPFSRLAVLHFATHAVARSDFPNLSALHLSAFDSSGTIIGKSSLSSDDIYRLGIRAELVVLSACSTGNGDAVRGEGVLGLTHSFLANGSDAVVASLWPVDDAQTSRFMSAFYAAYRSNANATLALRSAQQEMLKNPESRAERYWAGFVIRENAIH